MSYTYTNYVIVTNLLISNLDPTYSIVFGIIVKKYSRYSYSKYSYIELDKAN